MSDPLTPPRASTASSIIRRRADSVVGPVNREIAGWQGQAALLKARIQSSHLDASVRAAARVEAGGLTHRITQHLTSLERTVSQLPADVQASARIDDTFRAMHQVIHGLRRALVTSPQAGHDGKH